MNESWINLHIPDELIQEPQTSSEASIHRLEISCKLYKIEHDLEEVFESAKADVVMVAGVTLLQNEKLRAQLDFRIFLESDADQRLAEFIKKAKKGPDDDVEAIMEQYFTQVKPSYEQTLQWKDHAHFFAEVNMPEGEFSLSLANTIF
uniref:Phosphoribulokinase/uridine kinase domain-containing protein n=1 Tax=Parascaris equorum TaxID=6256 RepID=A0A914RLL7_PAREQ